MKIETTIQPRRDGCVNVVTASGAKYAFKADADGRLVAEVTEQADIVFLLKISEFLPADEADFEIAAALMPKPAEEEETGVDDGTLVGEVEDLPDDIPADENAAPVETPTAPKAGKAKKAK